MNILEKTKRFGTALACSVFLLSPGNVIGQHNISVDAARTINDISTKPVGINLNHLMDGSFLQPANQTADAIKGMGMKFLRFPGGEKSDNYLWSISPWDKSNPHYARTGSCEWPSNDSRFAENDNKIAKDIVLDFDEFITMSKSIGGEPLIVVAYDAMYKASSCNGTVPTRSELLKNAEEWVRYSNIVKGYNVKYWMIGNESYKNCDYNGCSNATQYRDDIIEFSKRMKAVDPSIKIIANGDGSDWWKTVLPKAAYHIDYIGLNNFPVINYTGGYDYYRNNAPPFMNVIKNTKNYINKFAPKSERNRIKIITTEFNSVDFSGKWADANDVGHALASFEILGEHLKEPIVEATLFWNTRWIDNATNLNEIFDALSNTSNLHANGLAISILGNNLLKNMVYSNATKQVRSFACYDPSTKQLNLFLINKQTSNQTANITISNYERTAIGEKWIFKGISQSDVNPTLSKSGTETLNGDKLTLNLPPVSITMVKLSPSIILVEEETSSSTDTTSIDTETTTAPDSTTTTETTDLPADTTTTSPSTTITTTPVAGGPINSISINAMSTLNDVSNKPIGINMDYLMDGTYLTPTISTTIALKNMGVKFLRYPGGEKADNYLWSVSPWDKSNPKFARTGSCEWPTADSRFGNSDYTTAKSLVLDFDEFITMSKTIGGEPLIVVAYDAMYKTSSCGGKVPTREELLRNAEEWVRYSNKVKGYNVKYWMIGNESYMSCNYNGCATATQYRDDVIEFSKRMKAVDPSIKIIANGDSEGWFSTVLPTASAHIDFIGISNYPAYNFSGGYDYYKNNTPDFIGGVRNIERYINKYSPASERSRLKVITTEFNSTDWSGKWVDANDQGHALAAFEILGDHLKTPLVESAIFWNTRWVDNTTKPQHIYDALDKNGNFNANGLAMSIWGNYILDKMVSTTSTTKVRSYATFNPTSNELSVFLVNKETNNVTADISFANYITNAYGEWWIMQGDGVTDLFPKWSQNGEVQLNGNSMSVNLPAVSITMLKLKPSSQAIAGNPIFSVEEVASIKTDLFELFPNPATNIVNLKFLEESDESFTLKCFSVDGREIFSALIPANQTSVELEVTTLPKGIYIIQISNKNRSSNQKLVIE